MSLDNDGLLTRAEAFAHLVVASVDEPEVDEIDEQHLVKVMRVRKGASISVTDGDGKWRMSEWTGDALAAVGDVHEDNVSTPELTVAFAPIKGDRTEWTVQKLTELGIDNIWLLNDTERAVVRWSGERATRQIERMSRIAREAVMQSRRTRLPEVRTATMDEALVVSGAMAHFDGDVLDERCVTVMIGPEGGWSENELMRAKKRIALGSTVLRAETASISAAARMTALRTAL